jgi:SAM-dependent methyltransferase
VTPGQAYEAFLVPALFRPWAEAVLKLYPPWIGTHVLDVACGTGIGGRLAARIVGPGGRVVGLDFDAGMLAVARRGVRSSEDAPIEWHQGDAQEMPFGAATFDYVICLEGIQFFPSRLAGLREIRRVLRPGGHFVASAWGPLHTNPAYEAVAESLRAFVSDEAACLPPFTLTDAEEIRSAVAAVGFGRVGVSAETLTLTVPSAEAFVEWLAAGAPTIRRNLAQLPEGRRADFSQLVAQRLERYRTAGGLSMPSCRHVVVAE